VQAPQSIIASCSPIVILFATLQIAV
jgi:hypothetical protein